MAKRHRRETCDYSKSESWPVNWSGWYCTRDRGHDGPCALVPTLRKKIQLRLMGIEPPK
jgi:hypothetical protein